ncbi:type 2 DNA topoisomerase 6 subunit B-like [Denticeps clupeoides]|uniref:type 2 DNA topoisomerase 6 subunit B-like n=1 Tax=Denticeps clupeoides TaxID=299321 RepID=UPI0010A59C16|nr:type 2 DNA topoisomerase 6 subunit B-like [Denticeps clupeoides]
MPLWIAPLLGAAGRQKVDRARRKLAYRLIHRKLFIHRLGFGPDNISPTYVFPPELKELIRAVFPGERCDYPDPCHEKVVRLLMVLVRKRQPGCVRGGLLVLLSPDRLACTVAAAGPWCLQVPVENGLGDAVEMLSGSASICSPPDPEEFCAFTETFGPLHFLISFQVSNSGHGLNVNQTERFLHRLSLVNAHVEIVFRRINNESSCQWIYGDGVKSSLSLERCNVVMDTASLQLRQFPSTPLTPCCRMHPVSGGEVELLLPPELLETGLFGDASLSSMAGLTPCMDQYPNWPTCVSHINISLLSPANMPLMQSEGAAPLSFLRSLTETVAWGELGLSAVCYAGEQPEQQGCLRAEMEFSTKDVDRAQDSRYTVVQTLTVFLFFQQLDSFHLQPSDLMASEEALEQHTDRILWHNSEKVVTSLQSLLKKVLQPYQRRCMIQGKMKSAMQVILSSMTSVVNSSSCREFRTACLESMRAQDTHELSTSLELSLECATRKRFVPVRRCWNRETTAVNDNRSCLVNVRTQEKGEQM